MTTNIDQLISELQTLKNSKNALKGILDNASTEQMIVDDTGVSIGKLKVELVSGKLVVNQSVETPLLIVSKNADIKNLRVNGTLTADTLYVKKIISEQPQEKNSDSINFYSQTTVDDKGIYWSDPSKTRQFVFKQDLNGFYSSESINLARGTKLSINGVPILEEHNLGQGVLHSNLRTVGKLEKLTVNGDSLLGETLFVNSTWSRVGIGTDKPNAALSIVDNLTELALGADENGQAFIGTWNNTVLNLVTDNTTRISIKSNIVEFGSTTNKNSIVKVHGTLEVDNLIYKNKTDSTNTSASVFVHPDTGRVGVGTKAPNSMFSIVENDVELVFGSTGNKRAFLGTHGPSGIDIRTDRKNRISITGNVVEVGSSKDNDAALKVYGTIFAETIISKNNTQIFNAAIEFSDQSNNGVVWKTTTGNKLFKFNSDTQVFDSSSAINIPYSSSFKIAGRDVITHNSLGSSIIHSSLTDVGTLNNLTVKGVTELANTVFVSDSKAGINTKNPRATFSVADNGVEVIISSRDNKGYVGTYDNNPLVLGSSNKSVVTISNNLTEFGNSSNRNTTVKIYGTLEVDNIISDTRIEKTGPIEFLQSDSENLYYTGMLWKSKTENKRFMLMPSPDRLLSSEHIELAANKNYIIGNNIVLSQDKLGSSVLESSLTKLGILSSLEVNGNVNLSNAVVVENNRITFNNPFTIKDGLGVLVISSTEINSSGSKFTFKLNGSDTIKIEETGNIVFGNKNNTTRKINAYGQLAVNITNPDSSVSMAVEGDVQLNNKKFSHGHAAPQTGQWKKADIVWNTEPQDNGFVGWICVVSGSPGIWKPFGHIIDR